MTRKARHDHVVARLIQRIRKLGELTRRIRESVKENNGTPRSISMCTENRRAAIRNDTVVGDNEVPRAVDRVGIVFCRLRVGSKIARAHGNHRGEAEGEHRAAPDRSETREDHVKGWNGVERLTSNARTMLLPILRPSSCPVPQNSLNAQAASPRTAFALRMKCHPECKSR